MADKDTGLNIVIGAVADEASAKKASEDIVKQVLGALKDGYIEIPTTISDKFDKSKASVKLIKAQEDFINQWKKMSAEGFSSSEDDLKAFVDKFTEFKRLMGKEGKSNSKQNLAIRDLGLGEVIQSYRKATKELNTKLKTITAPIETKKETTKVKQTTNKTSTPKNKYAGVKSTGPKDLRSDSWIDPGRTNSHDAPLSEFSGYPSGFNRQMTISERESRREHKKDDKSYNYGTEYANAAADKAIKAGRNKNKLSDAQKAKEQSSILSRDIIPQLLKSILNADSDDKIKELTDQLMNTSEAIYKLNADAGKTTFSAATSQINDALNQYYSSKRPYWWNIWRR